MIGCVNGDVQVPASGGAGVGDEIRLLGGFSVRVDGQIVDPSRWHRRAPARLVKLLALARGHRLHREQVMDALWPECAPAQAAARLHKATHFVRRALGSTAIGMEGGCMVLLPARDVVVDVEMFESLAGRVLDPGVDGDVDEALRWFRGELLPDDLYEDWSVERRASVRHLRLQLLRRARRWTEVLNIDPLDEPAHVEVMRSHLGRGDRAAAIAQFDELTAALERELGVAPGPEARAARACAEATTSPVAPRADRPAPRQDIRFCRADDGLNLAYAVSGDGPPLVKAANWLSHLEHDWESSIWQHWLHTLSSTSQLLRYDERGCGLSDWDTETFDVDAWVADLLSVVDAAGYDRFPLLGISQGAAVAIEFAAAHPDRVSALILYGSYIAGPLSPAGDPEQRRTYGLLAEIAELGWASDDPSFRQVFTTRFMPDGTKEQWAEFNELQRRTTSPHNAARFLRAFATIDGTHAAARVRCPTLVAHVRDDRLPGLEQARMIAGLIPDSRFVSLPGHNHLMLADEPAWPQFCDELNRFLDDVNATDQRQQAADHPPRSHRQAGPQRTHGMTPHRRSNPASSPALRHERQLVQAP
jgi:DNA-binding SARP family transcriptional activator/pimeloyl-ACP methyl ester carboxylesterase